MAHRSFQHSRGGTFQSFVRPDRELVTMTSTLLAAVCLALCSAVRINALQWTSSKNLPDNSTVTVCVGDNVTLAWNYQTDAAEHVLDTEWLFQQKGGSEEMLATFIRDNFLVTPTITQNVQFVSNAGLGMLHVTTQDSGTYTVNVVLNIHGSVVVKSQMVLLEVTDARAQDSPTTTDGRLHVTLLPRAMQNNATGKLHLQLACGTFSRLGQPAASVVWTTPSNESLASTYYDNGNYILVVDNPVVSGQYTCQLLHTPSSMCLSADSPLLNAAVLNVNGVEARVTLLEDMLQALQTELNSIVRGCCNAVHEPADCQEVRQYDRVSGVHTLYINSTHDTVKVFCDQDTDGGGWTVIQRRQDGSVDFYRGWDEYETGFGNVSAEHWLVSALCPGLQNIYRLTNSGNYSLRVDLEDWDGSTAYAVYNSFRIEDASDNYRLRISGYHGNASDSMTLIITNNNQQFSTYDNEHDSQRGGCATHWHGAWWFNNCGYSNLNGRYYTDPSVRNDDSVGWYFWKSDWRSYKRAEMKIRPHA